MTGRLTVRQLEILALFRIATTDQVARRLRVSKGTVSMTLRAIRERLGVETTEQAVQVALHRGWIG